MLTYRNYVIVFDLDDTIYKEIDFLRSAYYDIACFLDKKHSVKLYERMLSLYDTKQNVFSVLEDDFNVDISVLLKRYRNHHPNIRLLSGVNDFILNVKRDGAIIGIITDGRSITQRNKLNALGISDLIDNIIISEEFGSEKPAEGNYTYFEKKYPGRKYIYIGDNFNKDFITPNKLGWQTIGIRDDGSNIHLQNLDISYEFCPKLLVNDFLEISRL